MKQVWAIKSLLDARSQQTFITQRVVDELKLKPLRKINMKVSSFLCVPNICPNIKGHSVKQELKKRDFMEALKLADMSILPQCSIDMLIGSDICWDFVT